MTHKYQRQGEHKQIVFQMEANLSGRPPVEESKDKKR